MKDTENDNSASEKETWQNEKKKLLRKLSSLESRFTDLDTSICSEDDLKEMKTEAIPLINVIMQRLDIDAREL